MSTHNITFSLEKDNHPKFSQTCSHIFFSNVLKKEIETARVNEQSGFEPLMF